MAQGKVTYSLTPDTAAPVQSAKTQVTYSLTPEPEPTSPLGKALTPELRRAIVTRPNISERILSNFEQDKLPLPVNALLDVVAPHLKPTLMDPVKALRVLTRAPHFITNYSLTDIKGGSVDFLDALTKAYVEEEQQGLPNMDTMPWAHTAVDLGNLIGQTVEGFSTPDNLAVLAGMTLTGGGTLIPKAAALSQQLQLASRLKVINAFINGGFSAQMGIHAWDATSQGIQAYQQGDYETAKYYLSNGLVQSTFALLAGHGSKASIEQARYLAQGERSIPGYNQVISNLQKATGGEMPKFAPFRAMETKKFLTERRATIRPYEEPPVILQPRQGDIARTFFNEGQERAQVTSDMIRRAIEREGEPSGTLMSSDLLKSRSAARQGGSIEEARLRMKVLTGQATPEEMSQYIQLLGQRAIPLSEGKVTLEKGEGERIVQTGTTFYSGLDPVEAARQTVKLTKDVIRAAKDAGIKVIDSVRNKPPQISWMSPDGNTHLPAYAWGHETIANTVRDAMPPSQSAYGAMFDNGWIRKSDYNSYSVGNVPTKQQLDAIEMDVLRSGHPSGIILEYFDQAAQEGRYLTIPKQDMIDKGLEQAFNQATKKFAGSRYNTLMYSGIDPIGWSRTLFNQWRNSESAAARRAIDREFSGGPGAITDLLKEASRVAKLQGVDALSEMRERLGKQGINIGLPARDLGMIARMVGSITQQLARFGDANKLPVANQFADYIANTAIRINKNILNDRRVFHQVFAKYYQQWPEMVKLLDDLNVTPKNIREVNPKLADGYLTLRDLLDTHRLAIIQARRRGDLERGLTQEQALAHTPDDWGIKAGYFPHIFDGNWAIFRKVAGEWQPIEQGWRAVTLDDALDTVGKIKQADPSAELSIQLDEGKFRDSYGTIAGQGKVRVILDKIKQAYKLEGDDLWDAVRDVGKLAGAMEYGPKRTVPRMFASALRRESNLPGWLDTKEAFEIYLRGVNRYIQLYEARPKLLNMRNEMAKWQAAQGKQVGQALSIRELNPHSSVSNLLGKVDSSIEALEGYPNWFEQTLRNQFERRGLNPRLVDNAIDSVMEIEALLKLGYSPVSALTNLSQTLIATYPILGEKWTAYGIRNLYSSKYTPLLDALGIESQSSRLEISNLRDFKHMLEFKQDKSGAYHISPLRTAYEAGKDFGLFMFSKAEFANRGIAAIGAYEKGLSEGLNHAQALQYAQQVVIRTQGLYHQLDSPAILRMLPRPVAQFKSFHLKMMELATGLKGAEVPRFVIGAILGGGLKSLPGFALLMAMYKYAFGDDADEALNQWGRNVQKEIGIDPMGGAPTAVGIDLSRNIGFGDWFGPNSLSGSQMFGPALSDLYNAYKGAKYIPSDVINVPLYWLGQPELGAIGKESAEGSAGATDFWRGLSPQLRRFYDEAVRLRPSKDILLKGGTLESALEESVKPKKLLDPRTGDVVLSDLTPSERVRLFLGTTPSRIVEEQERNRSVNRLLAGDTDTRSYYINSLANLRVELSDESLSTEERSRLTERLTKLLSEAVSDGVYDAQLARAVNERARFKEIERWERDVRHAPRRQRRVIYEMTPEEERRPQ